jgi:opacity protein-like surface antigen
LRKIILTSLSFLTLLAGSSSFAAMTAASGWYTEANIGKSQTNDISLPGSKARRGLAWGAVMGYKMHTFAGVELGYEHFADTSLQSNGVNTAKIRQAAYHLAGKVFLPIGTTAFEVIGKAGLGRLKSRLFLNSPSSNPLNLSPRTWVVTGMFVGAGLGYTIMPNLQATAQWSFIHGRGNTGSPNLYTLGLTYLG